MTVTPEERKVIARRLMAEGATQKEIAKAIGMSIATVNKIVQEIRAEEPACDLQRLDTLSKDGETYRVMGITDAVITVRQTSSLKYGEKGRTIDIPVMAYVSGKSGYHKLAIPPVKVSKIEPKDAGKQVPEKSNHEEVASKSAEEIVEEFESAESRENHEEISSRRNILKQAEKAVCQDREKQYGSPEDNFKVIAELWSTYLECQVDAQDVASMMILLKLARVTTGHAHADNWVDIAGYAACAGEIESREVEQ